MYAIIETGGKQYQVREGDEIFIEKLDVNADDAITFDKVIAVGKDSGLEVGAPYVNGAAVGTYSAMSTICILLASVTTSGKH